MKTTDPSLQAAADVAAAFVIPETDDVAGFRLAAYVSAAELEQLLTVVRAAIAAPVLALHQPCCDTPQGQRGKGCPKCYPVSYRVCGTCRPGERYPCPTVRALGVTG